MLKRTFPFILILYIVFNGTWIHPSIAESTSSEGFIIEADRVEGVISLPSIVTGETSHSPKKVMLRLCFAKSTIYGMRLTKINAGITMQMTSNGPDELSKMCADVTKLTFDEIYIPRVGEVGLKNIRLVAHKQTADLASLPNLDVRFAQNNFQTTSDSEEHLKLLNEKLTALLKENPDQHTFPITMDDLLNGKKDPEGEETNDPNKDTQKDETKTEDNSKKEEPKEKNEDNSQQDDAAGQPKEDSQQDEDPPTDGTQNSDEKSQQTDNPKNGGTDDNNTIVTDPSNNP
ncbi:hypothetical protein MXL46_08675 [Heyndrickxia sporothermodurans]|nr:hypothetical protein [Heyndrickxia sporothermodurans]MBL5767262.1 hypothetical protein [Heyndrickxia sporothermodurans]MBL5770797.1 hypothetical protein [Heyndrickxia sporothermodurans]MBL5774428.1 hypothetical protein [Heyndrickxia sporothermodurans]MBL5777975.1 hypothetical protein [Heyndrickxia sporothermodurans]MBL5781553.1 hypothetical protein [Heyndrickxia sporothermodurans]